MRCPCCEIPEGQVLPSISPTAPRPNGSWLQSDSVQVSVSLGEGSEDKPIVQLFVVKDCSGPDTAPYTSLCKVFEIGLLVLLLPLSLQLLLLLLLLLPQAPEDVHQKR